MINIDSSYVFDLAHLLDTGVLMLSFALIVQKRMFAVIKVYSYQAMVLATAAAWQAYAQDAPHLIVTAIIALMFKAIIIPIWLNKIVENFNISRSTETTLGSGITFLIAISLVILSIALVFPITETSGALTRESLTIALSVVLLGFLMMITRTNAISQVVGFMSIENGLILAAVGVKGMPLVVEISIALSVLVAFIIFGIFFFHIREQFDTLDVRNLERIRGERFK